MKDSSEVPSKCAVLNGKSLSEHEPKSGIQALNDPTIALKRVEDGMALVMNEMGHLTEIHRGATWMDPVAAVHDTFGGKFADTARQYSIDTSQMFVSKDTFHRYGTGESLPDAKQLARLLKHMSKEGRPVPDELQQELTEAYDRASEIPRVLRSRVGAAATQAAAAAAQVTATAARIDQLQGHIIDLKRAVAASSVNSPEACRLRGELARANDDLKRALVQQHEDSKHLSKSAAEMSRLVAAYLDLVNPDPPENADYDGELSDSAERDVDDGEPSVST